MNEETLPVKVLQIVPDPSAPPGVEAGARADVRVGGTVWRNAPVAVLRKPGGGRVIVCFMAGSDFDAEASGEWGEPGTAPPKRPQAQAALWNRVQRVVARAYRKAEAEGRLTPRRGAA